MRGKQSFTRRSLTGKIWKEGAAKAASFFMGKSLRKFEKRG